MSGLEGVIVLNSTQQVFLSKLRLPEGTVARAAALLAACYSQLVAASLLPRLPVSPAGPHLACPAAAFSPCPLPLAASLPQLCARPPLVLSEWFLVYCEPPLLLSLYPSSAAIPALRAPASPFRTPSAPPRSASASRSRSPILSADESGPHFL